MGGYECNSKEHDYGEVASVKACADKCKATKGCNFFVFGTGDKAGKCDWEKTTSASCPEGWQKDEYDFYKMNGASAKEEDRRRRRAAEVLKSATLVKKGYECNSKEHDYGEVASVKACADKCKATKGCNFFVFGTGDKAGKCDWEKTTSASCPEGWQKDEYDFYKMNGASAKEEDKAKEKEKKKAAAAAAKKKTKVCEPAEVQGQEYYAMDDNKYCYHIIAGEVLDQDYTSKSESKCNKGGFRKDVTIGRGKGISSHYPNGDSKHCPGGKHRSAKLTIKRVPHARSGAVVT